MSRSPSRLSIPPRRNRRAVRLPVRPARRADEAAARQRHGALSGRVLEGERDGLVYEFKLREGLKFHNGDPFTAEDVKSASCAIAAPPRTFCTTGSRPWTSLT